MANRKSLIASWVYQRARGSAYGNLFVSSIVLGVIGALSAQVFLYMLRWAQHLLLGGIAGYGPPGVPSEGGALHQTIGAHGLWLIPVATTLGGLVSGVLVYSLAPEAEGHGTDAAVKAFHRAGGFIRWRVAPLKAVASAITIGSGGAAGREGPTALIAAGIASIYGSVRRLPDQQRRTLVLVGMASGLSAIFRSPIGTALFAIEVLYSGMEVEAPVLLYTMLGSIVAYAVNGLFVGYAPLFTVPDGVMTMPTFHDYGWYVLLGAAAGPVAALLPSIFYGLRDAFHALPLPPHFKPAIGGLGVGLMALFLPQVLGGGYGWIQDAIDGRLATQLLGWLLLAKLLAFGLTVSSGGSGGVFAPSLFIGAMLGAFLAKLLNLPSAPFCVVGMAAVFGAAARVPVATLLMVTEMTGGYHLLVPAALAILLSYRIQSLLSSRLKYPSLYEAQVLDRTHSPAHHVEQLESTIHLLGRSGLAVPSTITHLDLRDLLMSGIPVDLPGGKQLMLGVLRADSPLVGKAVRESFPIDGQDDVELAAVERSSDTLLPHSNLGLCAGDRLLAIVSANGSSKLLPHVDPMSARDAAAAPPASAGARR